MKKQFFFLGLLSLSFYVNAQNVGINTTSPQASLDVRGNIRLGGLNHFKTYDSVSGKIEWRNSNLYVPVSQYLMQHSAAADGLYYNNSGGITGQLEYRNASGNPVFYTNFTNGNGYFSNRLGIGNLTPQFPLSLNGTIGDKISLWTDGTPTHYGFGIQPGLLQMFSKTSVDDIAFGYGSSSSFVEAVRIKGNGYMGIGTASPNAPLGFPAALGKKITLYPGATGDVGMAVQGNLFQIYSDHPNADIALGYDQAGVMTERMRIKGNGNVGIGIVDPLYPLDINGRMRLNGTNPYDPGIWFNDAGIDRAFIGLENNNYVGFYGNQGAGWKFTMNTQTGALKVNGTEGTAGQVIKSNGPGQTAGWESPTKSIYDNTVMKVQNTPIIIAPGYPVTYFPGLSHTFTLTQNTKIVITYTVSARPVQCLFCDPSSMLMFINGDGSSTAILNELISNFEYRSLNGTYLMELGPGAHTIKIGTVVNSGPSVEFCIYESRMVLLMIPN